MDNPNVSDKKSKPTREERLAEQLRQNLRRRKVQARALDSQSDSPQNCEGTAAAKTAADTVSEA